MEEAENRLIIMKVAWHGSLCTRPWRAECVYTKPIRCIWHIYTPDKHEMTDEAVVAERAGVMHICGQKVVRATQYSAHFRLYWKSCHMVASDP